MHSENVYVTLKALQSSILYLLIDRIMEFHSKSVIWELILQCDPKMIEQVLALMSEYVVVRVFGRS